MTPLFWHIRTALVPAEQDLGAEDSENELEPPPPNVAGLAYHSSEAIQTLPSENPPHHNQE